MSWRTLGNCASSLVSGLRALEMGRPLLHEQREVCVILARAVVEAHGCATQGSADLNRAMQRTLLLRVEVDHAGRGRLRDGNVVVRLDHIDQRRRADGQQRENSLACETRPSNGELPDAQQHRQQVCNTQRTRTFRTRPCLEGAGPVPPPGSNSSLILL